MPDYSEGDYFLKTKLGLNYYRNQSEFLNYFQNHVKFQLLSSVFSLQ